MSLLELDLVKQTTKQIKKIREKIHATQSRQKSYKTHIRLGDKKTPIGRWIGDKKKLMDLFPKLYSISLQ